MKRILTLIVTLVCVFAAYSQNTVYIWRDNTLSVQAADSITIDRSFGSWVDMGLSVLWQNKTATDKVIRWYLADEKYGSLSGGIRLPTIQEFQELHDRCTYSYYNGYDGYTGVYGNTVFFLSSVYYWTASPYVYWKYNIFLKDQDAYAHVWLVRE